MPRNRYPLIRPTGTFSPMYWGEGIGITRISENLYTHCASNCERCGKEANSLYLLEGRFAPGLLAQSRGQDARP